MSPEQKAKIGAAVRRRFAEPELRERHAASLRGNRNAAGGRGKPKSPEHRAKIAAAQKAAWERGREPDRVTGECVYCGAPATTRDHPFPPSRGGDREFTVPCCRTCNESKADRTPAEWLAAGLRGSGGRYRQRHGEAA